MAFAIFFLSFVLLFYEKLQVLQKILICILKQYLVVLKIILNKLTIVSCKF